MPVKSRARWWIPALLVVALGFAAWMAAGEWFWRNPEQVSDSESAIVQPTRPVQPPAPERPYRPEDGGADATGDASRGQSAVRDGRPTT